MKLTAVLPAAFLSLLAGAAAAEDYVVGNLAITQTWARATPRGAPIAAAYLTITNKGSEPDRLMGGSTVVANRFEVHSMEIEDGVAKMRPVEGGLEIKPGQTVELKPGSLHVMLVGLKQPLQQGQHVKGTLVFEKAGKVDVEFSVASIGATTPAPAGHTGH
jgi:copper(I)-binding protein